MGVVGKVGLFDEGFYPAYFEDNDYQRRCERAGVQISYGPDVDHKNSSTLKTEGAGFAGPNDRSFRANSLLFAEDRPHGFDPYRWRHLGWL
jgi:GT2 family glycosyltransferase